MRHDQTQEHISGCFCIMSALKNHFKKESNTVVYSKKSFVHPNQTSIYITRPNSRNLFDVIFIRLNTLRRHLKLETIRNC